MSQRDPKSWRLRLKLLSEVSLVDLGANQHASVLLFKRGAGSSDGIKDPARSMEGQMAETQLEKALADLRASQDQIANLTVKVNDLDRVVKEREADIRARDRDLADANLKLDREIAKHADPEETLLKSMPEAARTLYLAQKEANARLTKRLNEADEQAALAAIEKSISTEMAGLPVKPAELAPVLKAARTVLTEDQSKLLNDVLKAAAKTSRELAEIMKKVAGHGGNGASVDSTAAKVNKMAEDRAVAKGISFEKAYTQVITENPALYSAIEAERMANL